MLDLLLGKYLVIIPTTLHAPFPLKTVLSFLLLFRNKIGLKTIYSCLKVGQHQMAFRGAAEVPNSGVALYNLYFHSDLKHFQS